MKAFVLIYFILVFPCLMSFGQMSNSTQHINIKALAYKVSIDLYYSFSIDIYRNINYVKIVYSVLNRSTAKKLWVNFIDMKISPPTFINIDSIATIRALYKKDSVLISQGKNITYKSLLDSCFLTAAHQFENKQPDLVHIGGVFYQFIFEENGGNVKKVGAVSPTRFDFPFLTRLITETFSQYKPNLINFLNKDNTNGRYHRE